MFATHRLVLGQHLWRLPWERYGSVDRCPRLALGLARTVADVRDVLLERPSWLDFTSSPVCLGQEEGSTLAEDTSQSR